MLAKIDSEGFAVLDRFLDPPAVEALIAEFDRSDAAPDVAADEGARVKRGVVFARRNLLSLDFVRAFVSSPAVRSLFAGLCPGAVAVRAILFDKTGDANWTVPWHQDRSIAVAERREAAGFGPWSVKAGVVHVQPPVDVLASMLTFRFSLDDCGPENGPLRVVAGTHRTLLNADDVDAAAARGPERICTTRAGGVVVMRPLVLHASSPAKTVGRRRVLHVEFGPPGLPSGLQWAHV